MENVEIKQELLDDNVILEENNNMSSAESVNIKHEEDIGDDSEIEKKIVAKKYVRRKIMQCTVCLYETTHSGHLNRHIKYVHNLNNNETHKFKCEKCSYKTHFRENYTRHNLTHSKSVRKVEKVKCTECNFETVHKVSLKRHLKLHKKLEEIEHFTCLHCKYKSRFKRKIRNHVLRHLDNAELFKCGKCKFETKFKDNLRKHAKLHKN
ncbi:unnamed protein product [Brassicogethes aeneus]|uniref:C2H2-type domain-containing protein n=1 Tax=Brassicogethes aeneus TaxID=1431903 RepID=A0A9P0FQD3_BRAAE|nr:unnamed protein product [Brassicogethes aeneus]